MSTKQSGLDKEGYPDVDRNFRGIEIAAPQGEFLFGPDTRDPLFGSFAKITVTGVCQLPYPTFGLRGEWNRFLVLVAIDSGSKRVYAGTLKPSNNGTQARPMDPLEGTGLRPEDFANATIGQGFKPNLARDLYLPEEEAEYDVHAVLGPYKSNVVHIKVRRKK